MENYKIKVNNWDESKEVQELFVALGATNGVRQITSKWVCLYNKYITFYDILPNVEFKQVTLQYLRDLVVLKRNDIDDAVFKDNFGDIWYVDSTNNYWMFENGIWRKAEEPLFKLEPIKKESEEVKMKEYLVENMYGEYKLTDHHSGFSVEDLIEVPEGAEIFLLDESCGEYIFYFVKHDGDVFHEYYISGTNISHNTWIKGTIKELHKGMGEVLWQRNPETPNTSIQEKLKSIKKNGEVKMKEFLNPEQGYSLVECFVGETPIPKGWIEIPEGAEEYRDNHRFYKNNGKLFYATYGEWGEWVESGLTNFETLWQRNTTTPNTSIQEKLKFIEKWLNGEKIQYILGDISEKSQSEKTQWHNFTEGAMQYIKRPDIKFREAPKYVKINGIEFKSVEKLLKYVKNNFDLEDEE